MTEPCSCDQSRKWRAIARYFAMQARYNLMIFTAPGASSPKRYMEWRRKLEWIHGRVRRLGKQIEKF